MLTKNSDQKQPSSKKSSNTPNGNFHHKSLSSGEVTYGAHSNTAPFVQNPTLQIEVDPSGYGSTSTLSAVLDTISVSIKFKTEAELQTIKNLILCAISHDSVQYDMLHKQGMGTNAYDHKFKTAFGGTITYCRPGGKYASEDMGRMLVYLGGEYLGYRSLRDNLELVRTLVDRFNGKVTRLDTALDFFDDPTVLPLFRGAALNHNVVGTKKGRIIKNLEFDKPVGLDEDGETIYFGSPNSNKIAYVYDKGNQKKTGRTQHRYEVRWKESRAVNAVKELLAKDYPQTEEGDLQLVRDIAAMNFGAFDFKDRNVNPQACRCPRLPWWEQLVSLIGRTVIRPTKAEPKTLEEKEEWVRTAVASTLGMLAEVKGKQGFIATMLSIAEDGVSRFNDGHRALVKRTKAVGFGKLTTQTA